MFLSYSCRISSGSSSQSDYPNLLFSFYEFIVSFIYCVGFYFFNWITCHILLLFSWYILYAVVNLFNGIDCWFISSYFIVPGEVFMGFGIKDYKSLDFLWNVVIKLILWSALNRRLRHNSTLSIIKSSEWSITC